MTNNPENIRELLTEGAGLTPDQIEILRMRFGIDMKTDHTLTEVATYFDTTVAAVHELEVYALHKLRHPRVHV